MQERKRSWQATAVQGLDVLTKVVVVGVPTLYLIGWAYLEGFWEAFGIDDAAMGYATVDYVRMGGIGLISNFVGTLRSWSPLLFIPVGVMFLLIVARTFALGRLVKAKHVAARIRLRIRRDLLTLDDERAQIAEVLDKGVDTVANTSLSVLGIMLLALLFLLLTATSGSDLGKRRGDAWLEKIASAETGASTFSFAPAALGTEGGTIVVGCSPANCAVFNGRYVSVISRTAIPVMVPCRTVRADRQGSLYCAKQSLRK